MVHFGMIVCLRFAIKNKIALKFIREKLIA